ncbi:Protein MRPS-23 [Aphelenchoides avenae]|nr:Protein MRPS-23 [Aphelenchus avenae]
MTSSSSFEVTGLIRAGHLKWEDRPLWYDVYAALPPYEEPIWDLKYAKHGEPVRKIFYPEDTVRARFYKTFGSPGAISIENAKTNSVSQLFIQRYMDEAKRQPGATEDELFDSATEILQENGFTLKRRT